MANQFYLIQRGSFRNINNNFTSLLSGRPNALINPDYMGAAEFEWGAIPNAYRRIMGDYEEYSLHVTDIKTVGGVTLNIFCNNKYYNEILTAITDYIEEGGRLKEPAHMREHFKATNELYKYCLRTNFWWCIDRGSLGNWIAFIGATDRQRKFMEVINHDYNDWWLKKSEEDRREELMKARHW